MVRDFKKFALTVDEEGGIATVVHEQVRAGAIGPGQHLLRAPPVLLQRLALPGKHRRAVARHRRCGVVLHRTDCLSAQGWKQWTRGQVTHLNAAACVWPVLANTAASSHIAAQFVCRSSGSRECVTGSSTNGPLRSL